MQDKNKIVINDYIQGEPLSEENLDTTLDHVKNFRVLSQNIEIWMYTNYDYRYIMRQLPNLKTKENYNMFKRQIIIKKIDVLVDKNAHEKQFYEGEQEYEKSSKI